MFGNSINNVYGHYVFTLMWMLSLFVCWKMFWIVYFQGSRHFDMWVFLEVDCVYILFNFFFIMPMYKEPYFIKSYFLLEYTSTTYLAYYTISVSLNYGGSSIEASDWHTWHFKQKHHESFVLCEHFLKDFERVIFYYRSYLKCKCIWTIFPALHLMC